MQCCAPSCDSTAETASGKVTFHEFPSDSHLRAAWLRALGRQETPLPEPAVVCSLHFLDDDMYETESGSRQIRAGAIPSTVQVCMICLHTDHKMFLISRNHELVEAYQHLSGNPPCDLGNLKQTLCVHCAQELIYFSRLRDKSSRARAMLMDLGQQHELYGGGDTAPGTKGDDMLSFLDITGSVRDRLQLEPVPMKPLTAPPEPTSDRSRPSTSVAAHKQEPTSAWLPPAPLPSDEFAARPTHIDKDGVIYLHGVSQQDTLHSIREALDARAKEPEPTAELVRWAAGEPCVALCRLDDRFYRGRVLEVDEDKSTCLVHYIDCGNEELCSFKNLRKSSDLYQIPTQAHKCILSGIRPIGENWDKQTLDYIHKIIVEKHCYVKVTGEPIGDVTPIDLKYDKLWISEHLVDFEMAVFTDGKKAVVRKFAPTAKESIELEETFESESGPGHVVEVDVASLRLMSDTDSDSKSESESEVVQEEERQPIIGTFATFPSFLETKFLCTIDLLNEKNIFELSVVHDNETGELYKQMQARLQSQSLETTLNGVYENKACLALYPADGQWYRASILQYSNAKKLIKVKFVDYGNIEVIALNDVREISDEYLELPPATVTATLHGVQFNAALDYMAEAEKIAGTFLDKDPFHAKVIKHDVIPSVELRDVDGKLIYDNLIRENIFICCHEESRS